MAKKARKPNVTISVRVRPELRKAISDYLERHPHLGDTSEFVRRLIYEALEKEKPPRKR